jgi:hypothetical protein
MLTAVQSKTGRNTLGMSESLPINFGQMLAGLYQDQVRNADQKAKAVRVYEGKASLEYRDANPSGLDSRGTRLTQALMLALTT